jgi:hypothetical protein
MLQLLGLATLLGAASATGGPGTPGANQTIEYLLELTASSRPAWISAMDRDVPGGPGGAVFDCSWRMLAYKLAPKLQRIDEIPAQKKALFDALELAQMCGEIFDAQENLLEPPTAQLKADADRPGTIEIFVSPTTGSDSAAGTEKKPLATIHGALAKARKESCRTKTPKCPVHISLFSGTYYIDDRLPGTQPYIELTPVDSELTISSVPGSKVYLSGGVELSALGALHHTLRSPAL